MSVEQQESESVDPNAKKGAPKLHGVVEKEENEDDAPAAGQPKILTAEQKADIQANLDSAISHAKLSNPAFAHMLGMFKGLGMFNSNNGGPKIETLDNVLKNVESIATNKNPSKADLAKYPGLKAYDGTPQSIKDNTLAIMQHMIDDKTLNLSKTQRQAILDHIPDMVKDGAENGYNPEKMAADMTAFIKSHGNAKIDSNFRLDNPPTQEKVTDVDGMSYGKAMSGRSMKGGFLAEMDVLNMDSSGHGTAGRSISRDAMIKELGGIDNIVVQAVHTTDTGIKLEAGKTPKDYVDSYYISNPKTGQGYYFGIKEGMDLSEVSSNDPNKRQALVNELMTAPEVAPVAAKPDTPAPAAVLESTQLFKPVNPSGPQLS